MTLCSKDSENKKPYLACIVVTDGPLCEARVIDAEGDTEAEARARCTDMAEQVGWSPPSWWQWWRKKDSNSVRVGLNSSL